jgi:hypothetical protein
VPAEGATVRCLGAYRLERRRAAEDAEQLPLAIDAHAGAVSALLGDEFELWMSPEQADAVADDLRAAAARARGAR